MKKSQIAGILFGVAMGVLFSVSLGTVGFALGAGFESNIKSKCTTFSKANAFDEDVVHLLFAFYSAL